MNSALPLPATTQPWRLPPWKQFLSRLLLNVVGWTAFAALSALTSLNDDLRSGLHPDFLEIFLDWGKSAIALSALSAIVYACLTRWTIVLASGLNIVLGYGLLILFYLPMQLLYVVDAYVNEAGHSLTWDAIQHQILVIDRFSCLLRLSSISAVYFAVVAIKVWQQSQERGRARAQDRADILALRLELEQQRLLALRAQLEPHFVFNALNAISALVLSDHKGNALDGISGLSDLLRYALTACEKNWVKFSEELTFLDDYLALQKLRYGARLHLSIEGVDARIEDGDCPPLLLQPLIENALRHDLDCHQQASDIRLQFRTQGAQLHIHISNPVHAESSANPGAGLGLRNTRARLQLVYGAAAILHTQVVNGRFEVDLQLPLYQHA
jgi:two-component system sensor histidine kinase AlgZ